MECNRQYKKNKDRQAIFDKRAKEIKWGKDYLFKKLKEQSDVHLQKEIIHKFHFFHEN